MYGYNTIGISRELLNFDVRKPIAKAQQQSQQVLSLFLASKFCYQTKANFTENFKKIQGDFF